MSTTGWRLTRSRAADGTYSVDWRCPECFARYKTRRTSIPATPAVEDPTKKK